MGCLRFRLDSTGSTEPIVSAVSNSVMLDCGASHASCCVISEATRGQCAVLGRFLGLVLEVTCVQQMYSRPLPVTAIDVCVRTNTTVATKLTHFASLQKTSASRPWCGVVVAVPILICLIVLNTLSKRSVRRRIVTSEAVVFRRLHSSITVEIWCRTARQFTCCWPFSAFLDEIVQVGWTTRVLSPLLRHLSVVPAHQDLASAWRLAHLARRTFVRETAHRGSPLVARRRFASLPLSQARLVACVARDMNTDTHTRAHFFSF